MTILTAEDIRDDPGDGQFVPLAEVQEDRRRFKDIIYRLCESIMDTIIVAETDAEDITGEETEEAIDG